MENESRFLWVGGLALLDWVNTEIASQGRPTDLIRSGDDLLSWLKEAGLLEPSERKAICEAWIQAPDRESETLEIVRAFRTVARRMAQEIVDHGRVTEETLAAVNERLRLRVGSFRIVSGDNGGYAPQFVEQLSCAATDCLVGRLAQTAEEMLCHADLSLIRRCENPGCVLFFYDTTKNHTRRWCRMTACGNRAKAAAHYQRKKATVAAGS